ncbi:MAG: ribose-phosphate pyrophosphokinase [Chloroflexota bacterium]|nr:MAG: ribose-phosphate pyrophosphokinase [Chloroflexota bacterium]
MEVCVCCGSASRALAEEVCGLLGSELGDVELARFPDGEIDLRIRNTVRGRDVYIIQSTEPPVNEHLVELLVMIDAFRRASAGRITAIVPYYGYSRQDRKSAPREPITAKLVANLLTVAGANRVISLDLHAPAIQGFFDIWMDHLTAVPLLARALADRKRSDSVIVSPDTGRVKEAERYARMLSTPLVVMHKQRLGPVQVESRTVVGDVRGKYPIIIDDMISTGATIHECATALVNQGARQHILVAATHGLLVSDALALLSMPAIREVLVTNTVSLPPDKAIPKLTVLSVAPLLAEAITAIHADRSISYLLAE